MCVCVCVCLWCSPVCFLFVNLSALTGEIKISIASRGNGVALQRAKMRMVRWMCGVKLKDRFPSKDLRD